MSPDLRRLRLEQTDQALAPFAPLTGHSPPIGGWLRSVRESLGRSLRVQASRLGVSMGTLQKSETAEADGRISVAQLRKLAEGLDCEVVYALIPRRPLEEMVEAQADRLARQEVLGVAHSMSLEDQRPSDKFVEQQIAKHRDALLVGSWSRLWR